MPGVTATEFTQLLSRITLKQYRESRAQQLRSELLLGTVVYLQGIFLLNIVLYVVMAQGGAAANCPES